MRVNIPIEYKGTTHEGGPAKRISPEQELRRLVMSCMLWENNFYSTGNATAKRIAELVPQVDAQTVAEMAIEARTKMYLRHVPLFLVREMVRHPSHRSMVRSTLIAIVLRADELTEFLALYWKDGRVPLAKSVQRGLADAFLRFNAYQLAKYNRDNPVKLRDVLFLSHAKPMHDQAGVQIPGIKKKRYRRGPVRRGNMLWRQLADNLLPTPDTWEVAISQAGSDKVKKLETWRRLIAEDRLGGLAMLRNLRNITESGVPTLEIRMALERMRVNMVLPFRYLAAVKVAPMFAESLNKLMLLNLENQPKLPGETVLLVDVSDSMNKPISKKSQMTRMDAACGLAVFAREICEGVRIMTFSEKLVEIANFRGLSIAEGVRQSQNHRGTHLGAAIRGIHATSAAYDRLIVITDEQSADKVPPPNGKGYMINVASEKPGIGYGAWNHIDGWSEKVLDYIRVEENIDVVADLEGDDSSDNDE